MAGKRYVLHSMRPFRKLAVVFGLATATYVELVLRSGASADERAIMFSLAAFLASLAISFVVIDRNFREGKIVFEIDDEGVVLTQSTLRPRPRRVPFLAIRSISVKRRANQQVSFELRPHRGRRVTIRFEDATCDYILSRIPSSIPVRDLEVPAARVMQR